MRIFKMKKSWKFIVYPLVMALINLLLIKIIFSNFISDIDLNAVLLDEPPKFETHINSIFTGESEFEYGTIDFGEIEFPKTNTEYGKFEIESVGISAPLIFGDGFEVLKKGVGQYHGSYIPGYGGTILTTGHNHMFPEVEKLNIGDIIKITTTYGVYKYKVSNIKIVNENEYKSINLEDDKEQLIYYTCYPFTSLADANSRYFVYADYVSGPKILK